MKRLYRVQVEATTEVVVVAESEEEAHNIAADDAWTDIDLVGASHCYGAHEVRKPNELPEGWIAESIPFGEDGEDRADWTCEKYWAAAKAREEAEPFVDPRQVDWTETT